MLLRLGPPPSSLTDADLGTGDWHRLAQLPLWALQLLSIPVGGIVALLFFAAWTLFTPSFDVSFAPTSHLCGVLFLLVMAGLLLQLCAHPGMGATQASILGFWPSRLTPYTACLLWLGREQFIASLLLPLAGLGLLPLVVASALQISPGWLVFAFCASAAIFSTHLLLAVPALRLPHGCVLAGQRFRVYWKRQP